MERPSRGNKSILDYIIVQVVKTTSSVAGSPTKNFRDSLAWHRGAIAAAENPVCKLKK
jgi:hypothetical protein